MFLFVSRFHNVFWYIGSTRWVHSLTFACKIHPNRFQVIPLVWTWHIRYVHKAWYRASICKAALRTPLHLSQSMRAILTAPDRVSANTRPRHPPPAWGYSVWPQHCPKLQSALCHALEIITPASGGKASLHSTIKGKYACRPRGSRTIQGHRRR